MLIKDILTGLKVEDLAGSDRASLITVLTDSPVVEAARKQKKNKIGMVVVCDAEGRLAGVLSERDVVHGLAEHGGNVLDMTVESLMTKDVETCLLDDPPHLIMARMSAGGFRHMPVVEGGTLRGIISSRDIIQHYVENGSPDEQAELMKNLTWV